MVDYSKKARQSYKSPLTNYSLYEVCFGLWTDYFFANSTDHANDIKLIHFMMDMTEEFQKDTENKLIRMGYLDGMEAIGKRKKMIHFMMDMTEEFQKDTENKLVDIGYRAGMERITEILNDKVKEWNKEKDDLNKIIKKKDRELKNYLQPDRQTYKLIDIKKLTDFLNNHPNYVPIRNIEDKFLVKKITK